MLYLTGRAWKNLLGLARIFFEVSQVGVSQGGLARIYSWVNLCPLFRTPGEHVNLNYRFSLNNTNTFNDRKVSVRIPDGDLGGFLV